MQIVTRSEWGARHRDGFHRRRLPASRVWGHHMASRGQNGAAIIRKLEQVGQDRFGAGMSYSWLITPDGTIYEGLTPAASGSHTRNDNDASSAICWVGNYEVEYLTDAQIDSTVWLLQEGVRRGWWTRAALTGGHRDAPGASTACPGRHAHARIPEINRQAATAAPEEDDMLSAEDIWMHGIRNANGDTVPAQAYLQAVDRRVADLESALLKPLRSEVVGADGKQSTFTAPLSRFTTLIDKATYETRTELRALAAEIKARLDKIEGGK